MSCFPCHHHLRVAKLPFRWWPWEFASTTTRPSTTQIEAGNGRCFLGMPAVLLSDEAIPWCKFCEGTTLHKNLGHSCFYIFHCFVAKKKGYIFPSFVKSKRVERDRAVQRDQWMTWDVLVQVRFSQDIQDILRSSSNHI